MVIVPAGTVATAVFTASAPTWSNTKYGWYDGNDRYIGGLDWGGSATYNDKFFFQNPEREKYTVREIADDAIETAKIKNLNVTEGKLANSAVAQAKLKTSQGEVSATSQAHLVLPGGEYGFYPRVRVSAGSGLAQITKGMTSTSFITSITLQGVGGTLYANQRYITASGPLKWIFLLFDKSTKQLISTYIGEDHPCYGNGGDLQLLPHPFLDFDSKTQEIVVLNPTDGEWQEIIDNCLTEDRMFDPRKSLWESFCELFEVDEKSKANYPDIDITIGLNVDNQPVKKRIAKPEMIMVKKIKKKY